MNKDIVGLHLHTTHSLLDGLGQAEDFAKRAKEMGFKYLGVTNHGAADGLVKFQKACEGNDIIPILGVEFYIVPSPDVKEKKERRAHICAWIKNDKGFTNILKLLTMANLDYFYHRPRVGYDLVLDHCEGIVWGTACSSSFLNHPGGIDFFEKLHKKVKDDIFLEVMPHLYPEQVETNKLCADLSKKYGVKLLYTQDTHYVNKEDSESHDVLLAVQTQKRIDDPDRWRFTGTDFFLCDKKYAENRFKEQGILSDDQIKQAFDSTIEVAKKCEGFRIKSKPVSLPTPPQYVGMDLDEVFKNLIVSGFKKRFGEDITL